MQCDYYDLLDVLQYTTHTFQKHWYFHGHNERTGFRNQNEYESQDHDIEGLGFGVSGIGSFWHGMTFFISKWNLPSSVHCGIDFWPKSFARCMEIHVSSINSKQISLISVISLLHIRSRTYICPFQYRNTSVRAECFKSDQRLFCLPFLGQCHF